MEPSTSENAFEPLREAAISDSILTHPTLAHAAQVPAQGLPGDNALKFRQYPLAETCDPPAHHTMKVRCRSLLDPLHQCHAGPVPGGACHQGSAPDRDLAALQPRALRH